MSQIPYPGGKPWSKGILGYILANPTYTGCTIWNKKAKSRKYNPEADWVVVENTHPAIIDRDTFEKRRQLARLRSFGNNLQNPHRHVNWLLSRLIKCGECGANYVGQRQRELYHYICGSYITQGRHVCTGFRIAREFIEPKVVEIIQEHISTPEKLAEIEGMVKEMLEERRRKYAYTTTGVETKLSNIDKKIRNFYNALGEGLDPKVCKQKIGELEQVKAQLEKEAAILRKEDYYAKAINENLQLIRKYAATFKEDFWSMEFGKQRLVVEHFIDRIEIIDHKIARIYFKIPFDHGGIKLLADTPQKGRKARPEGISPRSPIGKTNSPAAYQSGQVWGVKKFITANCPRNPGRWPIIF